MLLLLLLELEVVLLVVCLQYYIVFYSVIIYYIILYQCMPYYIILCSDILYFIIFCISVCLLLILVIMQLLRRCGRAVVGIVLRTEEPSVVHVGVVCAALEASHDGVIRQLQRLFVVAALRPILTRKHLLCVYRFRRHRKPCGSWYAEQGGG